MSATNTTLSELRTARDGCAVRTTGQRFEKHSVGTVQAAHDKPENEKAVKAQGLSVVIDNDCGELIKVISSPIMVPVVMLIGIRHHDRRRLW